MARKLNTQDRAKAAKTRIAIAIGPGLARPGEREEAPPQPAPEMPMAENPVEMLSGIASQLEEFGQDLAPDQQEQVRAIIAALGALAETFLGEMPKETPVEEELPAGGEKEAIEEEKTE